MTAENPTSSPGLTMREPALSLSPPEPAPCSWDIIHYQGPHIWMTYPDGHFELLPDEGQTVTNGTYSESLTRIQTSYLHAISALEERNRSLQQDLNIARAPTALRCADLTTDIAQRMNFLEEQNDYLQLELDAARSHLEERRADNEAFHTKLAEKNVTIKERNKKIVDLEQTIRQLQTEMRDGKRKNRGASGWRRSHAETGNAFPTGRRTMEPTIGQTSTDRRGIGAVGGGKAQKKRKLLEFVRANEDVRGNEDNPWVID